MSEEKKTIKVAVVPGDAPQRVEYKDGDTVGAILTKAQITLSHDQEIRLDGELSNSSSQLTGDHLSLVVGKRTAGN